MAPRSAGLSKASEKEKPVSLCETGFLWKAVVYALRGAACLVVRVTAATTTAVWG
jgi:hypothetical protein